MSAPSSKNSVYQTPGHRKHWLARILIAAFALCSLAYAPGVINSQIVQNYTKSVEPILQEKCAACHNHSVRQGGLNLESYEALMNGGKHGAVIVAGQSGESRLVKMIEGSIKPRMPIGDSLTGEEIKVIKAWIDAGAPGPGAASVQPANEASIAAPASKIKIPEIKPTSPVKAAAGSLAFHPDGHPGVMMVAVGRYQEVELTDATKGALIGKLAGHADQVRALAFSPDGKRLAAAGGNPAQFGEVKIWSVAERKEILSIRGHRDNIFDVAFSPDGTSLATCSYDRLIKLWDAATGKEIKTLKDHTDAVFSIAFSPDGKRLASASADRTVKVWDVETGQRIYTLSDALDAVNTVAFHPSGKLLAAAGADRYIRVWELGENDGRQIKSLIAHEDAINVIAFSPDGKTLASTGADKRIKIWDFAKLEEIHTTEVQPDWVFALSFSPDGKRLAIGRYDGSIVFYDPATGKHLAGK
ncbi:MAG: c-type cytochrome domain-containing protein [Blastocatellales bacterium]